MKKTVTLFRILIGICFLTGLFTMNVAKASHAAGGDLSYINVAPNIYVIKYTLFRDCSGVPLGSSETLTYRAPGCYANIRTLSLNLNSQSVGAPYCNSVASTCSAGGPTNYEEFVYQGTLTLPTLCPNWILSCRIGNRNESRNLSNGGSEWLFSEAFINNVATQTNSSPRFGKLPIPFVGVDKQITFNHSVVETDGDSLVYSLQPALTDLNVPVLYSSYPFGVSPAGTAYPAGTFSGSNPIITQGPISIDAFTGTLSFKPLSFIGPAAQSSQGRDKYVMVVQVDEYRKINGTVVKIGHVRRDMMVTVIDCGANQLPNIGSFTVNGTSFTPGSILQIAAGQTINITVNSIDDNPANIVTLTTNIVDALPGATFTVTPGARPVGTISWTPTVAQMREVPYYFSVTVTDNACPVKGFQIFSFGFRVRTTGTVTGISKNLPTGSFTAYPNPSNSNQISFKLTNIKADKNAEVLIYNVTGKVVDQIKVKAEEEQIQWNKKADLPAGVYFARLTSDAGSQTIKLVHLK